MGVATSFFPTLSDLASSVNGWVQGERNIPDPTEYLKVDGSRVKPRNGKLSFRIAEVMEEVTYLDHVRLLAVDHPSDTVVNPNEYFASLPPFPEFKVITTRNARPPALCSRRRWTRRSSAAFESRPTIRDRVRLSSLYRLRENALSRTRSWTNRCKQSRCG
jgi:hypothetical protein